MGGEVSHKAHPGPFQLKAASCCIRTLKETKTLCGKPGEDPQPRIDHKLWRTLKDS